MMRSTFWCEYWRPLMAGGLTVALMAVTALPVTAGATVLSQSVAIPSETPYDRALDAIALRDFAQSLNLLRIASAAGDVRADLLLADQLMRGLGGPRNDVEALRIYERTAARGSKSAQALLTVNRIRSGGGKAGLPQALTALKSLAEA
ncbi:MAG: hypothetical protein RJA24_536, partial [Pseudomonadota bacterium]